MDKTTVSLGDPITAELLFSFNYLQAHLDEIRKVCPTGAKFTVEDLGKLANNIIDVDELLQYVRVRGLTGEINGTWSTMKYTIRLADGLLHSDTKPALVIREALRVYMSWFNRGKPAQRDGDKPNFLHYRRETIACAQWYCGGGEITKGFEMNYHGTQFNRIIFEHNRETEIAYPNDQRYISEHANMIEPALAAVRGWLAESNTWV